MAPLVVKKAKLTESKNGLEFVLSSERPGADRHDDIIAVAGIDTTDFKRNAICLFNHHADQPIGRWTNLRVDGDKLKGNLHLAPKTTSPRLAEIHALVDARILRAVSIGFIPKESSPLKSGGKFYGKSVLAEVSLVAIPCNVDALMSVKGVSKELKKEIFKEQTRNASLSERIQEARAAVKSYSKQEKEEIHRKAKTKLAQIKSEKEKSDRLARHERLEAESKARVAKRKREEDQARQDRRDYQGFHWKGTDYFVEWRGEKKPIPESGGQKCWKWDKDK